jgi:hypothetical protein
MRFSRRRFTLLAFEAPAFEHVVHEAPSRSRSLPRPAASSSVQFNACIDASPTDLGAGMQPHDVPLLEEPHQRAELMQKRKKDANQAGTSELGSLRGVPTNEAQGSMSEPRTNLAFAADATCVKNA